jgi:hypothetical protein
MHRVIGTMVTNRISHPSPVDRAARPGVQRQEDDQGLRGRRPDRARPATSDRWNPRAQTVHRIPWIPAGIVPAATFPTARSLRAARWTSRRRSPPGGLVHFAFRVSIRGAAIATLQPNGVDRWSFVVRPGPRRAACTALNRGPVRYDMAKRTEPLHHDVRVRMLALRLLTGEQDAPESAWLLRGDLLERTWAWQAAQRLLERRRPPLEH